MSDMLVWGPASQGERTSLGRVLPAGWVWTCECGDSGTGLASEAMADQASMFHQRQHASRQPEERAP